MTSQTISNDTMVLRVFIVATLFAPFLIYWGTLNSLIAIWNRSDTFAHGYIILPISLWLIWQRKNELKDLAVQPCWPAMLLLLLCGFIWLLAVLAEVQVVAQYAFVALLPCVVLTLLGRKVTAAIAFPLTFLLLMVPFGEVFIDPLVNFTADFTVTAVQLTGIPVVREGNHFSLPSGDWSVVEACSGLRYLIASFTLGCLYAYLTYRSPVKRTVFILLSIVLPIIANGLRAFMIVMIGHFSGMKYAVGVDHLIYGWLFFGLVMMLFFWIGSYWREDVQVLETNSIKPSVTRKVSLVNIAFASFVIVCCVGIWPWYANYLQVVSKKDTVPVLSVVTTSNWQQASAFTSWQPEFTVANAEINQFYQKQQQMVGLWLKYYRNQQQTSKLVSSSNQIVSHGNDMWHKINVTTLKEKIVNSELSIQESAVRGERGALLVWKFYWIDGQLVASDYQAKFVQAKNMLLQKGDDGAVILLAAPYVSHADEARTTLRQFLSDNWVNIDSTLAQNMRKQ